MRLVAIQELDSMRLDLDDRATIPVLRLQHPALQLAIDENCATLFQLLDTVLRQLAPCDNAYVADIFDPLVVGVAKFPIRCDAKVCNGNSARRPPDHGVLREVPSDHDAIQLWHFQASHRGTETA